MRTVFRFFGLVFSAVLLVSLWPAYAYGEERSYEITNVELHARIDREGNMQVTEFDTYRFHGAFNGILVNLNSYASDGIDHFQAFEVNGRQENALEVETTSSGTVTEFKVYSKSEDETKVFKLTYSILNVVQVYADIAELYWKFFDETNPTTMDAVTIEVELPAEAGEDQVWTFGHGTAGSVQRLENGIVRYEVKPLPKGEFLEARILFPPSLVPGSLKIKPEPMLENILAEEEKWASTDEAEGEGFDYSLLGGLALLMANLAYGITVFCKYNRRLPSDWKGQYYRELPRDVTPAVVSYLMNFRIEPRDIMATLIDLARKKHVVIEERNHSAKRDKDGFVFRLRRADREELRPHEKTLMDWFFGELGHNGILSLAELKKYAKDPTNAKKFMKQWNSWQDKVKDAAQELGYVFVRKKKVYRWMIMAVVLQMAAIFAFLPESWYWTFICALPLLLFKPFRQRRTRLGFMEYNKWNAFKRFLRDYSQIASKEPLAVYLWEHYLVYAIPLGVAKKMNAISRIPIPGAEDPHTSSYLMTSSFLDSYENWTSSIGKTIRNSGDSGGDFSAGGGGGGGGGGRGAF